MAFLLKSTLKVGTSRFLISTTKNAEQLSTSAIILWQKQSPAQSNENNAQKKSKESIKITLIQNQNVTVTALEEAKAVAKRRSMHLVQIKKMDNKTQRPVYKLLTAAERLQLELSELKSQEMATADKTGSKKSEKTLNIGSRISDNDLSSRLKNISKWLDKRHEVRILIQGSDNDTSSCEKIFKTIDDYVKSPETIGKIVQKRTKGSVIKFSILPVNDASDNAPSSTKQ